MGIGMMNTLNFSYWDYMIKLTRICDEPKIVQK